MTTKFSSSFRKYHHMTSWTTITASSLLPSVRRTWTFFPKKRVKSASWQFCACFSWPDFADEVRPYWAKRSQVQVGVREGASQRRKRIFDNEVQFKHDLPHDIGSTNKKCGPQSLWMRPWLIGALEAADLLDILDRCSLNWKCYRRQESNISVLCIKAQSLCAGITIKHMIWKALL